MLVYYASSMLMKFPLLSGICISFNKVIYILITTQIPENYAQKFTRRNKIQYP